MIFDRTYAKLRRRIRHLSQENKKLNLYLKRLEQLLPGIVTVQRIQVFESGADLKIIPLNWDWPMLEFLVPTEYGFNKKAIYRGRATVHGQAQWVWFKDLSMTEQCTWIEVAR